MVGAGLAGLTCAKVLAESGTEVIVFEASDGVGGRVRTDERDGEDSSITGSMFSGEKAAEEVMRA